MGISPICFACGKGLMEFGGIILGPVDKEGYCRKEHLCPGCYVKLMKNLDSRAEPDEQGEAVELLREIQDYLSVIVPTNPKYSLRMKVENFLDRQPKQPSHTPKAV